MKRVIPVCAILVLITSLYFPCFGQTDKGQRLFQLDSMVATGIPFGEYELAATADDKLLWLYIPVWDKPDTVLFVTIDLFAKEMDSVYVTVPGIDFKIKHPIAKDIAVNQEFVVVSYFPNVFLLLSRNGKELTYDRFIPFNQYVNNIWLQDARLVLGYCYNIHPLSQENKTFIGVYDLDQDKIIHHKIPEFQNIEFSHFGPAQWIGASNVSNIGFSQTTDYQIEIYNNVLEPRYSITRSPPNWAQFPQDSMLAIRQLTNETTGKETIKRLTPLENTVSRVESILFLTDSLLLVRYIPADNMKLGRKRLFDLWKLGGTEAELLRHDVPDEKYTGDEPYTKLNYPVQAVYGTELFSAGKYILIKYGTGIMPLGKTRQELKAFEEEYYMDKPPVYEVYIYDIRP